MVTISRRKAKRLGISEDKRTNLTRNELKKIEMSSGQYEERNGKTFLRKEARAKYKPETIREETEIKKPTQTPIKRETIHLEGVKEKEKTGIAEFRERDTLAGKIVKTATSLKTTGVLGTVLAGLLTVGGSTAIQGGTAVITRTATIGGRTLTTQRAFVGATNTASKVNKIFHKVRPIATRYSTNTKSLSLTKSLFSKTGLSLSAVSLAVGAIGSYPFAGFIKEEAIQTLSVPIQTAIYNEDLEGAKKQVAAIDELINNQGGIMSKIPYANVLKELKDFFEAAEISNNQWKNIINITETEGTIKERQRAEDEKYYKNIEEEKEKKEIEEMQWKAEYYNLIREGKYEEAEELLKSRS